MEIRIKIFEGEDTNRVLEFVKALRYPISYKDKKISEYSDIVKDVEFLATFKDLNNFIDENKK